MIEIQRGKSGSWWIIVFKNTSNWWINYWMGSMNLDGTPSLSMNHLEAAQFETKELAENRVSYYFSSYDWRSEQHSWED